MMQYSEKAAPNGNVQTVNNNNNSNIVVAESDTIERDSQISLIPLWEHVVRTKTLPASLDLDILFASIHQRLRNPEWEVRQHALRVLSDFIPLIDSTILDSKVETIFNDLTKNLGHIGPAVRKAAVDSLRIYLIHSKNSDFILRNLAEKGIEHANENKVQNNVVLGIILALPFLLTYKTDEEVISYLIKILIDKLTNETQQQETVIRALFRIRELIGNRKFDRELILVHGDKAKKHFEVLCDIYNLHSLEDNENGLLMKDYERQLLTLKEHDSKTHTINVRNNPVEDNKTGNLNQLNDKVIKEEGNKITSDVVRNNGDYDDVDDDEDEVILSDAEDKVILETEIKLNSGSAIMMKIHEESRQNSFNDTTDSEDDVRNLKTFKVLSDSEQEDYELLRRTPRRVRFGGEIVKLRTPDSDSNQPSDDNDASIVIKPGTKSESLIEIRYVDSNGTRICSKTRKSLIPIRSKQDTQSAPSSPKKMMLHINRNKSKSSPNLTKINNYAKVSRIPRRYVYRRNERSIHIRIDEGSNVKIKDTNIFADTIKDKTRTLHKSQIQLKTNDKLTNKYETMGLNKKTEQLKTVQQQSQTPEPRKEQQIQSKAQQMQKKEQHISRKDQLIQRSDQLKRREQQIQEKIPLLQRREQQIQRDEQQMQRNEQQIQANEQQIQRKEQQSQMKNIQGYEQKIIKQAEENDDDGKNRNNEEKNLVYSNVRSTSPIPGPRRNSREDEFSPIPIHNEIEVFHNLTRSPERQQQKNEARNKIISENNDKIVRIDAKHVKEDRPITAVDNVYFNAKKPTRNIQTADQRTELLHPFAAGIPRKSLNSPIRAVYSPHIQENLIDSRHDRIKIGDNLKSVAVVPSPTPSNLQTNLLSTVTSQKNTSATSSTTQSSHRTLSSTSASINSNNNNNYQQLDVPADARNNFQSFKIYPNSDSFEFSDNSTQNKSGECLTSSFTSTSSLRDKEDEKFGKLIANIIDGILFKDGLRSKQKALEELIDTLKSKDVPTESIESYALSLINVLFSVEQQTALQHYAEEAITLLLTTINEKCLLSKLQHILHNICKIGSPVGVRIAIVIMRRISPNVIIDELVNHSMFKIKSSKVREGALQILMTITRIFPSNEINIPKVTKNVAPLLADRKRRVRHGALELIATLAQLLTPSEIMEIISEEIENVPENDMLMKVVQARLSRKQLPIVDVNGNVKYSTPSGDIEMNWLEKGSGTPSPQSASLGNYNNKNNRLRSNSAAIIPSTGKCNFPTSADIRLVGGDKRSYWNSNSRNYFSDVEQKQQEQRSSPENESDWSQISNREDSTNKIDTKIWAIDPKVFATNDKSINNYGTLRPLFVIEPNNKLNTKKDGVDKIERNTKLSRDQNFNYIRTSRGRSFSPPKKQKTDTTTTTATSTSFLSNERERFFHVSNDSGRTTKRRFVNLINQENYFRKSFSSEQLQTGTEKLPQPHFLSSGSSGSGSSVSSNATFTRNNNNNNNSNSNGIWYQQNHQHHHKDVRSGIPVAINSDFKMRFKTNNKRYDGSNSSNRGPVSVSAPHYDSKTASPQETPEKLVIQRTVMTCQPFSSGSDSSGYFTPPADPPETQRTPSRPISRNETEIIADRFIKINSQTDLKHNFTMLDNLESDDKDEDFNEDDDEIDDEDENDDGDFNDNLSKNVENSNRRPNILQLENSFDESRSEEEENKCMDEKNHQLKETVSLEEKAFDEVVLPRDDSFNFDEIDFNELRCNPDKTIWSKSEIKLNETPPDMLSRKTVTSAPSEHLKAIEYKPAKDKDEDNKSDRILMMVPPKTALPGSIDYGTNIERSPTKLTSSRRKLKMPLTRRFSCRTPRTANNLHKNIDTISRPFNKPKENLIEIMEHLESLEWESTMKGLQGLNKLIRFHIDLVDTNMHTICVALGKHIRNLRSQVARNACQVATEMFKEPRRVLEMELEELAAPLLHRTADTNKFLRNDANAALDEMCLNMSTPRVVSVITTRGSSHPNAIVRCTTARLLCSIVQRIGAERVFQMPRDTRDRILYSSANMLLEGSLETRKHAKLLFGLLCNHTQFNRALTEAVPAPTMRHIAKTLKTLK